MPHTCHFQPNSGVPPRTSVDAATTLTWDDVVSRTAPDDPRGSSKLAMPVRSRSPALVVCAGQGVVEPRCLVPAAPACHTRAAPHGAAARRSAPAAPTSRCARCAWASGTSARSTLSRGPFTWCHAGHCSLPEQAARNDANPVVARVGDTSLLSSAASMSDTTPGADPHPGRALHPLFLVHARASDAPRRARTGRRRKA